jgi:hypothetical protein
MRAAFLASVLLAGAGYTYLAFSALPYLSSAGRLGPGFFPRIIGIALIVLVLYSLAADRGRNTGSAAPSRHWRVTLALAALSAGFIALFEVLGGLLAMIAFMAAALAVLDPRRKLQNALVALGLPVAVYLVFRLWLNAAIPPGVLPLGF